MVASSRRTRIKLAARPCCGGQSALAPAPSAATLDAEQKQFEKVEADLWAWYLEWSAIERVAVTQRALLEQMGFVSTRAKGNAEEPADEGDGEDIVDPVTGIIRKTSPTAPITTKPVNGAPHA